MTYRNDHEAALLRVDALEHEVARLRSAAPPVPKPATKRRPYASLFRAGLALLLAGAGVVAVISRDRPTVQAAPAAERVVIRSDELSDCIAKIATVELDETRADPHGAASSTAGIIKTGASCRTELAAIAARVDEPLRSKVLLWATAEDKLVDPISMITVYYGVDPYRLDNYATAPQLWREYDRARIARDDALAQLKPMLADGIALR